MLLSGLSVQVADDEDLARFLTQSNQYSASSRVVKPAAFLPSPKSRDTSVSRHGRAPHDELKSLGLSAAGARPLYGAAIFKALNVRAGGLEVESREPPLRHAVVLGWPWIESDPDLQKAKQKEIAALLSSAAGVPLIF